MPEVIKQLKTFLIKVKAQISLLYLTKPVSYIDQSFFNMTLCGQTTLESEKLLTKLHFTFDFVFQDICRESYSTFKFGLTDRYNAR